MYTFFGNVYYLEREEKGSVRIKKYFDFFEHVYFVLLDVNT
jgi:hypothetical protein